MLLSKDFTERELNYLIARAKTNDARLYLVNKRSLIVLAISAIFVVFDGFMIYIFHQVAQSESSVSIVPKSLQNIIAAGDNIVYFQIINSIIAIILIYIMVRAYLESVRIRMVRQRLEVAIREAERSAAEHGL